MIEIPIEIPASGFSARPRPFSFTKKKRNREGGDDNDIFLRYDILKSKEPRVHVGRSELSGKISRLVRNWLIRNDRFLFKELEQHCACSSWVTVAGWT